VEEVDGRLEHWLRAVLETPGLTAMRDFDAARRFLLDDALRAVETLRGFEGPIVDVGSGGGTPGLPLAAAFPEREVTLLEASARKAAFLERVSVPFPNVQVIAGRAEEQEPDAYGVAVAKALAPPAVAAEWCLPLVRAGGAAILWVGESADLGRVDRAAARLAARRVEGPEGLVVLAKTGPTPPGFPRRTGVARKRPLA
jgi:16S rRNA (guanine527-N7)-methyltransferase